MRRVFAAAAILALSACSGSAENTSLSTQINRAAQCDKACLEDIAGRYRAAYLAHDPAMAPFAAEVRYTENNIEMPFPDGTWDTVTEDVGPALMMSDPVLGQVAIFTPIRQRAIEGYLGARLRVQDGQITEVEHIISTARNLSSPPTPIAPIADYALDPLFNVVIPQQRRASREELAAHANGYFDTLQLNDGEIRGTCFHPEAIRRENGMLFSDIKGGFESGRYLFNNRVRREVLLIDEDRQIALARGFIDHKGQLDEYQLTDGTPAKSIFQEPQSWGLLEAFKVTDGCIASVAATFYQAPYYTVSPWTPQGHVGGNSPE